MPRPRFLYFRNGPQEDAATTSVTEAPHRAHGGYKETLPLLQQPRRPPLEWRLQGKCLALVVFAHDNQIGALIGVAAIIYRRSAAVK